MTYTYQQVPVSAITTHPTHTGVFKHFINQYWIIHTNKNNVFFEYGTNQGVCSEDYKYLEHKRSTDPDIPADTHIERIPVVYIDVTYDYTRMFDC